MPTLTNCQHSKNGWCLTCVHKLDQEHRDVIQACATAMTLPINTPGYGVFWKNALVAAMSRGAKVCGGMDGAARVWIIGIPNKQNVIEGITVFHACHSLFEAREVTGGPRQVIAVYPDGHILEVWDDKTKSWKKDPSPKAPPEKYWIVESTAGSIEAGILMGKWNFVSGPYLVASQAICMGIGKGEGRHYVIEVSSGGTVIAKWDKINKNWKKYG